MERITLNSIIETTSRGYRGTPLDLVGWDADAGLTVLNGVEWPMPSVEQALLSSPDEDGETPWRTRYGNREIKLTVRARAGRRVVTVDGADARNLVANPKAAWNTLGWGSRSGAGDITRIVLDQGDDVPQVGADTAVRMDGSGADALYTEIDVEAGREYHASVWARAAEVDALLSVRTAGGDVIASAAAPVEPGQGWQRTEVSWIASADATVRFGPDVTDGTVAVTGALVHCATLGQGVGYFDGDSAGCKWTGAPHASASARLNGDRRIQQCIHDLSQAVAAINDQRPGSSLQRRLPTGDVVVADLIRATLDVNFGGAYRANHRADVQLTLTAAPFFRGRPRVVEPVSSYTAAGAVVQAYEDIAGDVPAEASLSLTNTDNVAYLSHRWGMRELGYPTDPADAVGQLHVEASANLIDEETATGGKCSRTRVGGQWTEVERWTADHHGQYLVLARARVAFTGLGSSATDPITALRLEWGTDTRITRTEPSVTLRPSPTASPWYVVPLGVIEIPQSAQPGAQWAGRVSAKAAVAADVDIDYLFLLPVERAGFAQANLATRRGLSWERRAFVQPTEQTAGTAVAGTLTETAQTINGSGDGDDFVYVGPTSNEIERTAVSDSSGLAGARVLTLGALAGGGETPNSVVQVDILQTGDGGSTGVVARSFSGNFASARINTSPDGLIGVRVLAGSVVVWSGSIRVVPGSWVRLRLQIDTSGNWVVWASPADELNPQPLAWGYRSEFQTGNSLAVGAVGLFDQHTGSAPSTRRLRNFCATVKPDIDLLLAPDSTLVVEGDSARVVDEDGVSQVVSSYEGDPLRIAPSTDAGRRIEIVSRVQRGLGGTMHPDVLTTAAHTPVLRYTPRFLWVDATVVADAPDQPPLLLTPPTIIGEPEIGESLSVVVGDWAGTGPITYTYQWLRADSPSDTAEEIPGETDDDYAPTSDDLGRALRVRVTATNALGETVVMTAYTDPITAAGGGLPPVNTSAPSITGDPQEGDLLIGSIGSWTGTPYPSFSLSWQRALDASGTGAETIPGSTSDSYTPTGADIGKHLRLVVVGSNTHGSDTGESAWTTAVAAYTAPPVNTAVPTVSGTLSEGETLTGTDGTWTGAPAPTYARQWQRATDASGTGAVAIAGATGSTYVLSEDDQGKYVRLVVTASNSSGSANVASAWTGPIAGDIGAPVNTIAPVISGAAAVGETLTSNTGSWTNGPAYSYQWRRATSPAGDVWEPITDAASATYDVQPADEGFYLACLVTAFNASGSASALSNYAGAVGPYVPSDGTWDEYTADDGAYAAWSLQGPPVGGAAVDSIAGRDLVLTAPFNSYTADGPGLDLPNGWEWFNDNMSLPGESGAWAITDGTRAGWECWIKVSDPGTIMSFGNVEEDGHQWRLRVTNDFRIAFELPAGAGDVTSDPIDPGSIVHIFVTKDNDDADGVRNTLRLYLDGTLAATTASSGNITLPSGDKYIVVGSEVNSSAYVGGDVAGLAFYRVFTPAWKVAERYERIVPPGGGGPSSPIDAVAAYFGADLRGRHLASAFPENDVSGNGEHGTHTGSLTVDPTGPARTPYGSVSGFSSSNRLSVPRVVGPGSGVGNSFALTFSYRIDTTGIQALLYDYPTGGLYSNNGTDITLDFPGAGGSPAGSSGGYGNWRLATIVYDDAAHTVTLYRGTTVLGTVSVTGTPTFTAEWIVGALYPNGGLPLHGALSEFWQISRALTAAEVGYLDDPTTLPGGGPPPPPPPPPPGP